MRRRNMNGMFSFVAGCSAPRRAPRHVDPEQFFNVARRAQSSVPSLTRRASRVSQPPDSNPPPPLSFSFGKCSWNLRQTLKDVTVCESVQRCTEHSLKGLTAALLCKGRSRAERDGVKACRPWLQGEEKKKGLTISMCTYLSVLTF